MDESNFEKLLRQEAAIQDAQAKLDLIYPQVEQFLLDLIKQHEGNDTIFFSVALHLYRKVRACVVQVYGEETIRRQEAKVLFVKDPPPELKN